MPGQSDFLPKVLQEPGRVVLRVSCGRVESPVRVFLVGLSGAWTSFQVLPTRRSDVFRAVVRLEQLSVGLESFGV